MSNTTPHITIPLPVAEIREIAREEARAVASAIASSIARDELARAAPPPPVRTFMRVKDYAVHRALSVRTIWELIDRGLPVVGARRLTRIPVADADAWIAAQGAAR